METKVTEKVKVDVERLKKLGLITAGETIDKVKLFNSQTAIAYEHFRYVSPEKFAEYNAKIKERTFEKRTYTFDRLAFVPLEKYAEVPPESVLDLLEQAQEKKCFDSFVVAKIESVQERPDPIIFGIIKNCADKFFIGQWDDDVKIEDIITENEG